MSHTNKEEKPLLPIWAWVLIMFAIIFVLDGYFNKFGFLTGILTAPLYLFR